MLVVYYLNLCFSKTQSGEEVVSTTKQRGLELEESLESQPDDPSLHFDLGLLLWEKAASSTGGEEIREKAAEQFLISAKLNPQNGDPFKYLGHYYASFSCDPQRALKCFQRAISLNPDDSDAGVNFNIPASFYLFIF